MNIAYYLYLKNMYFDYATNYVLKHNAIPPADKFQLTDADFDDFINYLKQNNFTYTSQAEKIFDELKRAADYDGITSSVQQEMDALQKKLKPSLEDDVLANKDDIENLLGLEIVRRYYFQKGEVEFSLQNDKELKTAESLIANDMEYNKLLTRK